MLRRACCFVADDRRIVDVVGVLELDQDDRVRDFTADEQALAQHLGNQIGVGSGCWISARCRSSCSARRSWRRWGG